MVGVERVKEKNITNVIFFYEDPSLLELSKGNDSNRYEASKARNLLQIARALRRTTVPAQIISVCCLLQIARALRRTTWQLHTKKPRHKGGFFNWWELRESKKKI